MQEVARAQQVDGQIPADRLMGVNLLRSDSAFMILNLMR